MTHTKHLAPLAAALALALAAACGSDGGNSSTDTSSACPNIEEGMDLEQIETAIGRTADNTESYGDFNNTTGHTWYFGDDDELIVQVSPQDRVTASAWHDGDQFMTERPTCPLGQR